MRRLNYELKQLGCTNHDGSFTTQANRAHMLSLMATQLYELGYVRHEAQRWNEENSSPCAGREGAVGAKH